MSISFNPKNATELLFFSEQTVQLAENLQIQLSKQIDALASQMKGFSWTIKTDEESVDSAYDHVKKCRRTYKELRASMEILISRFILCSSCLTNKEHKLDKLINKISFAYDVISFLKSQQIARLIVENAQGSLTNIDPSDYGTLTNAFDAIDPRVAKLFDNINSKKLTTEKIVRYSALARSLKENNYSSPATAEMLTGLFHKLAQQAETLLEENEINLQHIALVEESKNENTQSISPRPSSEILSSSPIIDSSIGMIRFTYKTDKNIYVRGVFEDCEELSWDNGKKLTCDPVSCEWTFIPPTGKGEFKFLLDNNTWEKGSDRKVGDQNSKPPVF